MKPNVPFTKELLKEKIDTGQNIVFSYPAGSGKTTAICEYIVEQIQSYNLIRKIIYVAPTKSLLDDMYNKLLKAGLSKDSIFNYHTSSENYRACCNMNYQENLKMAIIKASIILITHERMKFDATEKFRDQLDLKFGKQPLVFLDESIEDCNVASMSTRTLTQILRSSELISKTETQRDYKLKPKQPMENLRKVYACLIERNEKNQLCHLKELGIELADPVGFSESSDLSLEPIEQRFLNLYSLLAMAIAQGNWIENDLACFIKVPVAIHESWKHHAQIIVTDATAFINACVCKDFELVASYDWNTNLLTNYIDVAKENSRSNLEAHPQIAIDFLTKIDLTQYNKIYLVTFKNKLMKTVEDYIRKTYPQYRIEYFDSKDEQAFLETDIDNTTDELYTDSTKVDKIIYLANFGNTRGSNKFRSCDCVIQIGNYRINPEILKCLCVIYPELTSDKLAFVNYLQELYRGRIRCNIPMVSYALLDKQFYRYVKNNCKQINLKLIKYDELKGFSTKIKDPFNIYGMNKELVKFLYQSKLEYHTITKAELVSICQVQKWDKAKQRLFNLYKRYPQLQRDIFTKFKTFEDLQARLRIDKQELNLELA